MYSWIDPLFCLGCRRSLEFKDLYSHPPEADSQYLLTKFNKLANLYHCIAILILFRYWSIELERRRNGHSARLYLVWLKCFWWRYLLQGLLTFCEVKIY